MEKESKAFKGWPECRHFVSYLGFPDRLYSLWLQGLVPFFFPWGGGWHLTPITKSFYYISTDYFRRLNSSLPENVIFLTCIGNLWGVLRRVWKNIPTFLWKKKIEI